MKKSEKSIELGGKKLTLQTGVLAEQAHGAVLATYGETVVLATVVSKKLDKELDYFPLTVDYQERLYAGGRIKGSKWVKREGRPTDEEILSGRLIDRSIRPLFPKTYKKEVQVVVMVLSVDLENDPRILAEIAVSAAVAISQVPWKGPSVAIKIGLADGKYMVNPTDTEMKTSEFDLVVTSTKDAVVMIEAGAHQVSEKAILEGIKVAQKESQSVIALIDDLTKEVGTKKEAYEEVKAPVKLVGEIKKAVKGKVEKLVADMATHEGASDELSELVAAVSESYTDAEKKFIPEIIHDLEKEYFRELVLSGKRVDGRKLTEVRHLEAQVGVLPRVHGSAIFHRGQTQVLSVATLGAPSLGQLLESAEGEEEKQYMHHYSMPPYASGETGRVGQPSRREIGHGALAERALIPVIPGEEEFSYAIRVVSEVMSSNGSTSMASVCGSTLALMDAGVPLIEPVSGIAMGVIVDSPKKYSILTDIMGLEDFNGDMDFKVAGTKNGITALQLDVKTLQLTPEILEAALKQANEGRLFILDFMLKTLAEPRTNVSKHAPKIKSIRIPLDKIGELIGPGGRNIKRISAETGAQIDVNDDGLVFISGISEESLKEGVESVEAITKVPVAGEIYDGEVKRLLSFGAFVEILPGREGLVHVSDMSDDFVKDPADILSVGQQVQVRVKGVDDMGRLNLSMMLDPKFDEKKEERKNSMGPRNDQGPRRFTPREGGYNRGGGGSRPPYQRDNNRRSFDNKPGDRGASGGPHFPTSRFVGENKEGRFRK